MNALEITATIEDFVSRGGLVVANHSGGKDSQAMLVLLRKLVPVRQLLVVHAVLGEVEWDGGEELIRATAGDAQVILAHATKTFIEMVDRRGMFPSPSTRQCTSDLKRDPITREIRRYLKAHPEFGGLVLNCMGMRSQESAARSKLKVLKRDARNSVAGREWWDLLPIHHLTTDQVFASIAEAGQEPHWVYAAGMSRKSCAFCIMASDRDLCTAAKLRPALYQKMAKTERRLNFTLSMSRRPLTEITGIAIEDEA